MAKTRLTNAIRDSLHAWMMKEYDKRDNGLDAALVTAAEAANATIQAKYIPEDMAVLEKYCCTRIDDCLRFMEEDTGRVFGVSFPRACNLLAPVPRGRGCYSNDVFKVTGAQASALEAYAALKENLSERRSHKYQEYRAFLDACKTVEAVDEVVGLPDEIKHRYMTGGALIAINPEKIASIRNEFQAA